MHEQVGLVAQKTKNKNKTKKQKKKKKNNKPKTRQCSFTDVKIIFNKRCCDILVAFAVGVEEKLRQTFFFLLVI